MVLIPAQGIKVHRPFETVSPNATYQKRLSESQDTVVLISQEVHSGSFETGDV